MNLGERVSYLKGLAEGLSLDDQTKEGKILKVMLEVMDEMAEAITDLECDTEELYEAIDTLDEDLGMLEKDYYEFDEDDCDCDDCDCDDDDDYEDDELYEITCPSCGDVVYIDEEMLDEGFINCPNCGEKLEFDLDIDSDDDNGVIDITDK